jgi:23S rRNA (cytidine1920-2'-O)/16S rRNA (cytidine1409-2'-O)-methyltransferase
MGRPGRRRHRRFVALTKRMRQSYPEIEEPTGPIAEGHVLVNGAIVTNPAALVPTDATIRLQLRHQPRGRAKLAAALMTFDLLTTGRVAVDVGASTGGFTLALLDAGVERVYAVDAGHGQLLGRLRAEMRVVNLENTNIGDLRPQDVPEPVQLITVDVSYLSLARVAPQLEVLTIAEDADLVALVKPMYELGLPEPPAAETARQHAVELAVAGLESHGWCLRDTMPSPVTGAHGSIEYLIHLHRRQPGQRCEG